MAKQLQNTHHLSVFHTFDVQMCFTPQQRAMCRHLNFQKCFGPGVLCTCWLPNLLLPRFASTFSAAKLPKVLRTWCALRILTSNCASRHKGLHVFGSSASKGAPRIVFCRCRFGNLFLSSHKSVQLFIWPDGSALAALASLYLSTLRSHNHWRNTMFRDFSRTFRAPRSFLSSETFSSLIVFLLLFSSPALSTSAFYLSIYCRKFVTSRFPSLIVCWFLGMPDTTDWKPAWFSFTTTHVSWWEELRFFILLPGNLSQKPAVLSRSQVGIKRWVSMYVYLKIYEYFRNLYLYLHIYIYIYIFDLAYTYIYIYIYNLAII